MKTHPTSWRLTADDKALLAQLSQQYGLTQIDVIRHLLRLATRDGIHLGRRTLRKQGYSAEALTTHRLCDDHRAGGGIRMPEPHCDASVVVGGRMERSLGDFMRFCERYISEETQGPIPDTHLIALLCDAVRLAREMALMRQIPG